MSKPIKDMIVRDYQNRFNDLESALVVEVRGIEANENNDLRLNLQKKAIYITVVKNSLARKAFQGGPLESLEPSLKGPAAIVYGGESVVDVARELVDWAKKVKKLKLKGAVLDGEYFEGAEGVKRLSEFPTREEAQATVVTVVMSPARKLVGQATSPGSNLLAIVKEIQERLERGDEITKAS